MRILLISIAYLTRLNQKKLEELATIPGVELQVIVPTVWHETLHPNLTAQIPPNPRYSYRPTPTFFPGHAGRYFYRTLDFTIRQFRPDIIQVEDGWRSLPTFQAALCKRIWAPQARFIIFSWENIVRPLPMHRLVFQRFNLNYADCVICGNRDGVASIQSTGYRGSIVVVPQLGVDTDAFHKRNSGDLRYQLNIPSDTFVIGFAARMVPEKGVLCLLEAAAKMRGNWTLLLIGDGPDRKKVELRAQELGIASRIRMTGSVPHLELAKYYNAMDVLVSPSISSPTWKEQYGLVVLQAMNSQVPVVGSTCGETPHVIGDAGLIFHEGHVGQLVEHLNLLMSNLELRFDLGRRGHERVQNHFTFRSIAQRTYEVWEGQMR